MNVTVFYAWQDDRPKKVNRYLIRDAAQAACDEINEDPSNSYTLTLDQDTAGQPGMCDIPNTILGKIRDCDIFLADLTFAGESETESANEKPQLIPNPNVTLELGYAVGSKATRESDGFDRVIAVMNTAYGNPHEQMFDVKRRRPIRYNLPVGDTGALQRVQKSLIKDIKEALLTILSKAIFPKKEDTAAERFAQIRREFETSVHEAHFHGFTRDCAALAITLVPDVVQQLSCEEINERTFFPLGGYGCSERIHRGKSVVFTLNCSESPDQPGPEGQYSITEVTTEGVVYAARVLARRDALDKILSRSYERDVVTCILEYAARLHNLGVPLPWRLGISLLGVQGFSIPPPPSHRATRDICQEDRVACDPIIVRNFDDMHLTSVNEFLKDTFEHISSEFGY